MAVHTNNNTTYYINPAYLSFVENSGYGANLIQVSASSSCYIRVFIPGEIGYDADGNYRRWKITAYNNKFPDNDLFYIYVRLERDGTSALIVYSKQLYNTDGSLEDGSAGASDTYYYIRIGEASATDGTSIREISYDTGRLESDQVKNEGTELNEMWELDKHSTPWLIRAKQWLQSFTVKGFITLIGGLVFRNGDTEKPITDIKRSTDTDMEASDETVPTTKYVSNILEELDSKFLRKDVDDRSTGKIASDVGFEAGEFIPEATGAACYQDKDGNWHIETDHIRIRKKAIFTEVEVQEAHHVGGQMLLTAANMIVDYVFEMEDRYRCYFLKVDSDGREVENLWRTGDQAYCNTFNLGKQADGTLGNHYLWRLVVSTNLDTKEDAETRTFGDVTIFTADYNFTDLSKDICAELSDSPKANDEIVHLGYQPNDDPDRQNAILIAGAGSGSPYIYEFTGINQFVLPEPETQIKPGNNVFSGTMRIKGGSTGAANLEDLPDEVFKAVSIGAVNLLLNSGFTGDYKTEEMDSSYAMTNGSELFSKGLKYWVGAATVVDDSEATSGMSAAVGSLSQTVEIITDENYVVSFKAKGTSVSVSLGNITEEITLTSKYDRYTVKFVSDGVCTFSISGDATICNLQLERGTIATDWKPSPYDNDKTLAEFQALKYLQNAIVEGDTVTIGGLILSSIIMLGNYKDGKMQKVNAGVSGVYNDGDDVAFWGGGTYEQAIATAMKFKQNPLYIPTDNEWLNMASFVVTHGGNALFKGNVYADNGYFRGSVITGGGTTVLNKDGSGYFAGKSISWTKEGLMYRKAPEIIEWVNVYEYADFIITYEKGMYLDLRTSYSDPNAFELQTPRFSQLSIYVKYENISRSDGSAILKGSFLVNTGDKFESFEYIQVASESKGLPIRLDYYHDTWHVIGVLGRAQYSYLTETLIAEIGYEGKERVDLVKAVDIESEEISSGDYSVLVATEDGESKLKGLTTTVTIKDRTGDHTLSFQSGLLVSHKYEYVDN